MKYLSLLNKKGNHSKFHIVGIGGIGMSGIAEILFNLGYNVQGSDISENQNIERLRKLNIQIYIGHKETNVYGADYVVVSSSIKSTNVEYQEALKLSIPVIPRSEMLKEIMRMKNCITISGSHGKTSTTSIIASVFESAGLEPTVINGGIINKKSTNAYIGLGDYMVVEADESDATFINIPSTVGVITNIDPEHLDYYKTFDNLKDAFRKYINNLPFYGFAACCVDNQTTREIVESIITRKVITYGIDSEDANIRAYNIKQDSDGSYFNVSVKLHKNTIKYNIENIRISVPGRHNILNSLAAIAIATELDFGVKEILSGIENFKGVKRRFTKTAEYNKISFIDDYAHHPSEIVATTETARSIIKYKNSGRLISIFQPHRYTRLSSLFEDFITSFVNSDIICITPVYSAGEEAIEDFNHEKLSKEIAKKFPEKTVLHLSNENQIEEFISKIAKEDDIFLFMGAGSITNWANTIPHKIFNKSGI